MTRVIEEGMRDYGGETMREAAGTMTNILETGKSGVVTHKQYGDITVDAGETKNRSFGLKHIIKQRCDDGKSAKETTALMILLDGTLKNGKKNRDIIFKRQPNHRGRMELEAGGIIAIVSKQRNQGDNEQWVLTGFEDKESKEAADTIQKVISRYGYAPEFLDLEKQVGAVVSSLNIRTKNDSVKQISNKEQIMTEADQKKLDRENQLINEKAEVQADGSLRISMEDWRGINRELNKGNIEKNKLFEDAIRNIANETEGDRAYAEKLEKQNEAEKVNPNFQFGPDGTSFPKSWSKEKIDEWYAANKSESPPLERRNINSKENFMSDVDENEGQARDPKEEAFLNAVHQRKVIADALKAGKLSCLPGADGFADTQPALSLATGKVYRGVNLLLLKEHQRENGFPTAEYLTGAKIDEARKDNPDFLIRKGQKGVSIYVSEQNEETGEYETKYHRLFNVAQTTKPAAIKEWLRQEKLEYLQSQYGTNYQLPEPKEKVPGPEIVCSSTEPKEYLGQYLAAVSVGGKFKASPEQAAEFAQKLEGTLFERMENGHTNPFKLEKISIEASQYCKEFIPKALAEARKAEQPQQQQEQTQSRGRGM